METHLGYAAVFFHRTDDFGTQLLLQKKDRGWRGVDLWTPFGGRIEIGENPETCIKREIFEELGISITDEQIRFMSETSTVTNQGQTVPLYVFSCHFIWSISTIKLQEGCGFAFWYKDEIQSVPMQPHEKLIAEEIILSIEK